MFKQRILLIAAAVVALVAIPAIATAAGGFDQFGYNHTARVFSGPADGVDRVLDGKVWGDTTYANDHLVMKWNAAWDACNDNGYRQGTDNRLCWPAAALTGLQSHEKRVLNGYRLAFGIEDGPLVGRDQECAPGGGQCKKAVERDCKKIAGLCAAL